jgi:hypothetical protein
LPNRDKEATTAEDRPFMAAYTKKLCHSPRLRRQSHCETLSKCT